MAVEIERSLHRLIGLSRRLEEQHRLLGQLSRMFEQECKQLEVARRRCAGDRLSPEELEEVTSLVSAAREKII